jgi:hypothetical protein
MFALMLDVDYAFPGLITQCRVPMLHPWRIINVERSYFHVGPIGKYVVCRDAPRIQSRRGPVLFSILLLNGIIVSLAVFAFFFFN